MGRPCLLDLADGRPLVRWLDPRHGIVFLHRAIGEVVDEDIHRPKEYGDRRLDVSTYPWHEVTRTDTEMFAKCWPAADQVRRFGERAPEGRIGALHVRPPLRHQLKQFLRVARLDAVVVKARELAEHPVGLPCPFPRHRY